MKRSYKNGHKRIGEADFLHIYTSFNIIGSSNGLVCVINKYRELLVANPLTREVKPVPRPFACKFDIETVCGFGYDSRRDDYKIVIGVMKGEHKACFHVFSLKLNAWHAIKRVKYTYAEGNSVVGILCNGAIHSVMDPKNQKPKKVILSFDLSKEEFKEIPQPDYQMENMTYLGLSLGIMEECLCIKYNFNGVNRVTGDLFLAIRQLWVMKKYNEKQSLRMVDKFKINYEYFFGYPYCFQVRNDTFMGDLSMKGNIVQSLVSPHLQPDNDDRNDDVSDSIGTLGEEDANSEDDMSTHNGGSKMKSDGDEDDTLMGSDEDEVSEDEDDSGSDSDEDDVKSVDGMSIDSHGSDKVRGKKRKCVEFDDQIDYANHSLRALKRLAGAKSEYDVTSVAKVENKDTSDVTDGILSNEDFQRIKELKAKKDAKVVLANHGILKKASDPKSQPFRVPSSNQLSLKRVDGYTLEANIRKKMTKEERKALIKAGREGSVKYQSKAAVKQKKTGGLSNKQKEHKKAMPIAAKRSKIERSKRQKKIKHRGADKQFRGRKAWK